MEDALRDPEQTVAGYRDTLVAQSRWAGGLLRVLFVKVEEGRKILTLYWTSKVGRYWEANDDADTI